MKREFGPRRAEWFEISAEAAPLSPQDLLAFEKLDAAYRTLCAMLYNYAPMSGHPGGSISSGRFVAALLFETMQYDLLHPDREDADIISYAAGHKALGLYSMWALRNEIARIGEPSLLPDVRNQLRFEDLLGFRRNPKHETPLFHAYRSKALDGHPTPATPFVKLSTGASGVGMGSSLGLALGLADWYGADAPKVHIIEGEGGLTPGRVAEALAFAGTASLGNAVVHLDWNQASIDSEHVTREGATPGDYVQWDPCELLYANDWNVIYVADGFDFQSIVAAQRKAMEISNGQPTAIVYRTKKGWQYGIEGRASHGAGHKLCSPGFIDALPLPDATRAAVPRCAGETLCNNGSRRHSRRGSALCRRDAVQQRQQQHDGGALLLGFAHRRAHLA
jgi:transketolase